MLVAWRQQAIYQNQCLLIISEVLWYSPVGNLQEMPRISILDADLKMTDFK